jgi:hypothetical protein
LQICKYFEMCEQFWKSWIFSKFRTFFQIHEYFKIHEFISSSCTSIKSVKSFLIHEHFVTFMSTSLWTFLEPPLFFLICKKNNAWTFSNIHEHKTVHIFKIHEPFSNSRGFFNSTYFC